MTGVFFLSLVFVMLGAKGFTAPGLPLTSKTRITGARGRSIGAACLLVGIVGAALSFWAAPPNERHAIRLLSCGLALGVLGTASVLSGTSDPDAPPGEP